MMMNVPIASCTQGARDEGMFHSHGVCKLANDPGIARLTSIVYKGKLIEKQFPKPFIKWYLKRGLTSG